MSVAPAFRPATRHLALGGAFQHPVAPADVPRTDMRDHRWAERVGLDEIEAMRVARGA